MTRAIVGGLLLCLCSCSDVRTINGELFLTDRRGNIVILSGVEVAAYDMKASAAAFMADPDKLSKQRNDANKLYSKVTKLVELLSSGAKRAEAAKKSPGD